MTLAVARATRRARRSETARATTPEPCREPTPGRSPHARCTRASIWTLRAGRTRLPRHCTGRCRQFGLRTAHFDFSPARQVTAFSPLQPPLAKEFSRPECERRPNVCSFDIWRQTTSPPTTGSSYRFVVVDFTMEPCDGRPISIKSPKFLAALKSADHFGGNDGGNSLSFRSLFTLEFDSRRLHQNLRGRQWTSADLRGRSLSRFQFA